MNPEHVEIVKQGAEAVAEWRESNPGIRLDISQADLSGVSMVGVNLKGADLSGAVMSGADLTGAMLSRARMNHVNLTYVNMAFAILTEADLRLVNLTGANLNGTNLTLADLYEADLTEANLNSALLIGAILTRARLKETEMSETFCGLTIFANVDLSTAKGLERIKHIAPSSIGIDTLYRSGGIIPVPFLRGCGVPEEFIRYLPDIIGAEQAIQFYSCFISYNRKDEEFAKRLFERLQGAGLRVWYAPEEMKGGQKIHEQIFEGIRVHDKLLLVLSEHSMESEWVKTEIRRTRKAEREQKKQKLFPISLVDFEKIKEWECFDADSGKDLGVELREYFIPDFRNWKDHDTFEAGVTRLLKDLRANEA